MKKFFKIGLMTFLITSAVVLLTGCSNEEEKDNRVFVSFDEIHENDVAEDIYDTGKEFNNSIDEAIEEAGNTAQKQAIEIFNIKYSAYEGNSVNAATIKQLIQTIKVTNENNPEHQVSIEGVTSVSEISKGSTYSVIFRKDYNGYINKAIITEN